MKNIKLIISSLVMSFNLKDEGFSFRKIIAFIIMLLIVYIHFNFITESNVVNILFYDFVFVLALLGLINVDNFINAKYGKDDTKKDPDLKA